MFLPFCSQAHLVAAFEKSLGNMTGRLQSLTMTAEQKVCSGIATGASNETASRIGCWSNAWDASLKNNTTEEPFHAKGNNDKIIPFQILTERLNDSD